MEKCYTFKGHILENGLFCIFQAIGNIFFFFFFYKRCRARMTKHRQQNTKIRTKGINPIYSWYLVNYSVNIRLFKNDVYEFRKYIFYFLTFIIFLVEG